MTWWWFNLRQVDVTFLKTATWIFEMNLELKDVDADTCWKILTSKDDNFQYWHPEVTNITWYDNGKHRCVGSKRSIVFHDTVFDILLLGGCPLEEHFDIWDDTNYIWGFYMTRIGKPTFLTYTAVREEFRIIPKGDNGKNNGKNNGGCILHRKVAMEPSFLSRYLLGWLAYPRLRNVFEVKCPQRFRQALKEKKFKV